MSVGNEYGFGDDFLMSRNDYLVKKSIPTENKTQILELGSEIEHTHPPKMEKKKQENISDRTKGTFLSRHPKILFI